jgi:hypothetical protein
MQKLSYTEISKKYGWKTQDLVTVLEFLNPYTAKPVKLHGAVWLGGGALRRPILKQDTIGESDFDFFFETEAGYTSFLAFVVSLGFKVKKEMPSNITLTCTIKGDKDLVAEIVFQLIRIAYYPTAEELFQSFDFTLCQFAMELGTDTLLCGDTALYDVARKRIVLNKITYPVASMRRIIKYTNQGFYACGGFLKEFLQAISANPQSLDNKTEYVD